MSLELRTTPENPLRRIRRWVTSSSNSVIWKAQGVLSDGEFTAAEAKILGI